MEHHAVTDVIRLSKASNAVAMRSATAAATFGFDWRNFAMPLVTSRTVRALIGKRLRQAVEGPLRLLSALCGRSGSLRRFRKAAIRRVGSLCAKGLFQIRRQHIFDPFHECADSARQIAPMCYDEGHGERPATKIGYDLHKRSTL